MQALRVLCQKSLYLSDGLTDVPEAEAARSEWATAVLTESGKGPESSGDGVCHLADLAAGLCDRHGVVAAADIQR